MNIPEEFGNYLLLKKLREDALGETFRAGRVGRDGIEQVVLLRVFNGQGIDGERLWQRISGRAGVQQALRSPNVGTGVDLGKVRSFPYAAYDYISGKNLATLFAQAARQRQPIPIEHALLITERMALALAAAYETRFQEERLLHGFVAPHLVMISNEGETRMLGFEVAPGLRELWAGGWRNDDLRGYLAPEAAAPAAAAKTDDVYSLGAVLFELLASERLPLPLLIAVGGGADAAAAYGQMTALIDGLVLPNEGTSLPAPVAALLKKSLAPRDQRIPDAVTWHKTISKLMIDGQFSSTTFNLAFFMHNLFRDEIDRESQEIEAEKKLELPRRLAVAGAGSASGPAGAAAGLAGTLAAGAATAQGGGAGAADMRERTGVRDAGWAAGAGAAGASHAPGAGAAAGSDRKPLWIGLAAAAVLALGVGGYLLFGRGGASAKPGAQAAGAAGAAGTAPGGATAASAAEAARNAAALQAQIQQMIEARSKELETKLKSQYDDNIKQLQQKLEESRRTAAAAQEKDKARAERQAAGGGGAADTGATPAATEVRSPRSERAEAAAPAAATPAATGSSRATSPASQPPIAGAQRDPAGSSAVPAAGGSAAAATPAVPGTPAADSGGSRAPQIQVGDLVQAGPGVVMPRIIFRPSARYPAAARRMNRSAEVAVRVLVDEKGNVEKAEEVGGPAGLGFDEAALEVAHHSTYAPASKDGVRVKMWISMKVTFVP
jgi:TonB family protein